MPFDVTVLELFNERQILPGPNRPKTNKEVDPAKLKALLASEFSKKFNEKAKIKFVDCQDDSYNTSKQFVGALHMNLKSDNIATARFSAVMRQIPDAFRDLASADLVVFYCLIAASRSPNTMVNYLHTRDRAVDRTGFNKTQTVLLLQGGMTAYLKLQSPVLVAPYVTPKNGKILAVGKSTPVTQPSGDVDEPGDFGVIYT